MKRTLGPIVWTNRIRKLVQFFYVQRIKGFERPSTPHFDNETLRRFEEELRRSKFYIEYGSGGSTVLADQLGIPTISVEGDRFYAQAVRKALSAKTTVEIITPKMGITREWGMPIFFRSKKGARYVNAPFERSSNKFPDLVLIDGRYRVACALEVARRAFDAGANCLLIVDDYKDRVKYHVLEHYLGQPEMVGRAAVFEGGKTPIRKRVVKSHATQPA